MKQFIDSESMSICRYICIGFPGGTTSKETTCQCRKQKRLGLDSWVEKMASHFSILAWRIPWTRGAWRATVHRVAQSQTRL